MVNMICLDTYALVEIKNNNPKYAKIVNQDFIISAFTLAEFYYILLREETKEVANHWYQKLKPFIVQCNIGQLIKAMDFKFENRKINFSFFDCIGYITARENNSKFVTGDKGFKNVENIIYIRK